MNLNIINSVCRVASQKPIRSLQGLTVDQPEEIISAKLVSGRFGPQILLELKENSVFLPQRVTDVVSPYVSNLKGYRVVFRGTRKFGEHNQYQQVDFEILDPL